MAGTATAADEQQLGTLRQERAVDRRRRHERTLIAMLVAGQLGWLAGLGWVVVRLIG